MLETGTTSAATMSTGPVASPPQPGDVSGFVWQLWPWMAWLLPVMLYGLIARGDAGGWEMLFLLFASPLVLPAYALLNLLPRRMLRKRGMPGSTSLTTLLLLHWWGLATLALFWRGTGDSGSTDSVFGNIIWWLPESLEGVLALTGALVALASWIALLLLPELSRPGAKRRSFWPWAALVAPPLAVALTISLISAGSVIGEKDAAGNTEYDAMQISAAEARGIQESRWNDFQAELVPLRSAIAPGGWVALANSYVRSGATNLAGLVSGYDLESYREVLPSYALGIIWRAEIDQPLEDAVPRMHELAAAQGWALEWSDTDERDTGEEPTRLLGELMLFTDQEGNSFSIDARLPSDAQGFPMDAAFTVITVKAESAEYWKEDGFDFDWFGEATPEELEHVFGPSPRTFAANEWPELRFFQVGRY